MTFEEFISEYNLLKDKLPKPPTYSQGNEDSDFTTYTYRSANCSYCFDCVECKNCTFCFDCVRCSDCYDCDYCVECELSSSSVDSFRIYNSSYMDYCARVYDSHFCWHCDDSHNLFGCAHLKNKQYCIFNKQYTKEEYTQKVQKLQNLTPEENLKKLEGIKNMFPLGPTHVTSSENSIYGNHVHHSKNCYMCFDSVYSEDCGYLYDCAYCKESYDLTYCFKAELSYGCQDSAKIYNCDFVDWSSDCFDSSYLTNCQDCHNCFGCVAIAHKKYCILNKQYSEEEYKKIIKEIRAAVR